MTKPMEEPKVRPIRFRTDLAQKVHDRVKTQTRRTVQPQPTKNENAREFNPWPNIASHVTFDDLLEQTDYFLQIGYCPYGKPGDHLWVKESYHQGIGPTWGKNCILYNNGTVIGWHPGTPFDVPDLKQFKKVSDLFMPHWASRTLCQIDSIRLESLNSISREDCLKEGIQWSEGQRSEPMIDFVILWDQINGKTFPWASNPWVWVIDFHVIKAR